MSISANYVMVEEIGRGAMASVHKAIQRSLDRVVAIKKVLPKLAQSPDLLERFEREAKASANLHHVNIMDVYDYDRDDDGTYYIIMEYIDGPSLQDLVKRAPTLPLDVALSVILQLLDGLEHAHNNGVLHRDIKPANIMLTSQGVVKITDFGVSQVAAMPAMTSAGQLLGTPCYMSPEQASGRKLDNRSDLFSATIVLYECLTGHLPFDDQTVVGVLQRIMYSPPKDVTHLNPDLPEKLGRIIKRALDKEVASRFFDAAEFAYALESLAFDLQIRTGARVIKTFIEENFSSGIREMGAGGSPSVVRQIQPSTGLKKKRPTAAILPLQGCFGCQVNLLDLHERLPELHEMVDIQFSYLMDVKSFPRVDVGFVEGAVANTENEERLMEFRKHCDVLVALGTCACFGGIPGLRNLYMPDDVVERSYFEAESMNGGVPTVPSDAHVPALTSRVKVVSDVVKVDFIIPGCPSPHDLVIAAIKNLVDGDDLDIPTHNLCFSCTRTHDKMLKPQREFINDRVRALMELEEIHPTQCFLEQGVLCMGIATREGCGGRCLQMNMPCQGCMGPPAHVFETGAKWADALGSLLPGGAIRFKQDLVGLGYRYSMPISMIPCKQERRD